MRRVLLVLGLLAAVLAIGGCTQPPRSASPVPASATPETVPDDFRATITYRTASLPPPHRYEWTLELTGTHAVISWRPGYDESIQPWQTTVTLTPGQRATFYQQLRSAGAFGPVNDSNDKMVGGSSGRFELTAAARTYRQDSLGDNRDSGRLLGAVRQAVTTTIPAQIWEDFERRQAEWGKTTPPR